MRRTPPDLLAAVGSVTAAASAAPQSLLDALASVQVATADGPQRMLDALNGILSAVQATQAPPVVATAGQRLPTGAATPFASPVPQTVTFTFNGDIIVHVSGEQKTPREVAEETVKELRRMAMSHTGNTMVFGTW